jgi:tetratricopeptide (TPR) repeat protein
MAFSERILGRWDSTVAHLRAARALDPRSVRTATTYIESLLMVGDLREALAACESTLAIAPRNLTLIQDKAVIYAIQGDLSGTRAWIQSAERTVPADTLAAFLSMFGDLYWLLDERDQRRLPTLGPEAFGDRKARAEVLAQVYQLWGDSVQSRAWADSALAVTPADCREDSQCHAIKGVQLALAGRSEEAIREARLAVRILPISKDAYTGAYAQHQLVRTYLLTGHPDEALDALEPLLRTPYYVRPGWLRIDPGFTPLRGNPRFELLSSGGPLPPQG